MDWIKSEAASPQTVVAALSLICLLLRRPACWLRLGLIGIAAPGSSRAQTGVASGWDRDWTGFDSHQETRLPSVLLHLMRSMPHPQVSLLSLCAPVCMGGWVWMGRYG